MSDAIARKLYRFGVLSAEDTAALARLADPEKSYAPHDDIVEIGSKPEFALAILAGWAIRYVVLRNGSRQITAFLMPGDFCHLNILSLSPMDHSIAALSPVTAAHIEHRDVEHMFTAYPNLAHAVRASQFADEAHLRAMIANIGRQGALQRLGHMLCELWTRADAVGLTDGDRMHFPPTQADIADYIGLTAVHVNRMMQQLRRNGLVELKDRCLSLPDVNRLARASGYSTAATGHDRDRISLPNNRTSASRGSTIGNHSFF